MGFVNIKNNSGKCITVDKKNQISLEETMMHPDYDTSFELSINDQKVKFSGVCQNKVSKNSSKETTLKRDVIWDINEIYIPDNLEQERSQILETIRDALVARGYFCMLDKTESVSVKFSKPI